MFPLIIIILLNLNNVDAETTFDIKSLGSGPPNLIFRKFFDCSDRPTSINITIVPKWLNDTWQVLDGYVYTPLPIGNNLLVETAGYLSVQHHWIPLTNVSAKFCHFMSIYLGPLRSVTYGSLGLSSDTCPIPQGSYHPKNIHFDMLQSRIPAFPHGLFRFYITFRNIATHVLELCLGVLTENKPI